MACSCWSDELPQDILDLILQRLSLPDYFSVAGVCTSWRSVLLASRFCCPARLPPFMFVLDEDDGFPESSRSSVLMCLQREPLKLSSPRPQLTEFDYILGSSAGWFVIFTAGICVLQLMSHISNQRIPLPSTTDSGVDLMYVFPTIRFCFWIHNIVLSSAPTASDECIVVAGGIFGLNPLFASCSPGDRQWSTFVPKNWTSRNNQMVFHKGKLYIVAGNGGSVVAYSFVGRQPSMVAAYASHPNPMMSPIAPLPTGAKRLVVSGGELLGLVWPLVIENLRTVVEVYRWASDCGWTRLESLGDRVLLIGVRGAESFGTKDLMGSGFEANCIYYHYVDWFGPRLLLFKFSMADGSIERIPVPPDCKRLIGLEWIVTQQQHAG